MRHGGTASTPSGQGPWLSVVIPTYQGADYLDQALRSIAAQDDADGIEVWVVDDGSTDQTREIIQSWLHRLSIEALYLEHRGNWVRSTNRALTKVRGTWVSLLHQDDLWAPNRVSVLREQAAAHEDVNFILHSATFIDHTAHPIGHWRCPLPRGAELRPAEVLPRLAVQNFVPIVSPLVRRTLIQQVGPMDETLWYFADWDFWLRIASQARMLYLPQPLASFRIHTHSQTAQRTRDINEIGRQFDVVQERVQTYDAYPSSRNESATRMRTFSRAFYLWMLAGWHGDGPVSFGQMFRAALRLGPAGCFRYLRDARLLDRLLPRIRLYLRRNRSASS